MRVIGLRVLPVVAVALSVLLFAPAAQACCTSIICPFAVSSSSGCVGGPDMPVCNVFGCNCNVQCGMYTPNTTGTCTFSSPCNGGDAQARAQERFDSVDSNGDGAISNSEVASWMEGQKDFLKNANREKLPANLRGDNVTISDIAAYAVDKADTNKNGTVEPGEFDETLAKGRKRMSKD